MTTSIEQNICMGTELSATDKKLYDWRGTRYVISIMNKLDGYNNGIPKLRRSNALSGERRDTSIVLTDANNLKNYLQNNILDNCLRYIFQHNIGIVINSETEFQFINNKGQPIATWRDNSWI